jgi:murein L,D-transpeptidase YafK
MSQISYFFMNSSKLSYVQLFLSGIAVLLMVSKNLNSNTREIIPINEKVKKPTVRVDTEEISMFIKRKHDFYINVDVTLRQLLMIKNNEIMLNTDVALAESGFYKVKEGDKRLPLGEYYICDTRKSNGFHRFLQISYPSIKDADRGLKSGLINKEQYNRIVSANKRGVCPPSNTKLGGFIGIHAEHESWSKFYKNDWTFGCVAVDSKVIHKIESKIRAKMKKGKKVPIYIHK